MNASYKSFTLSVVLAWTTMQSFLGEVELRYPFQNNGTSPHYILTDRWHRADPYDPTSTWIPGTYPATRRNNTTHMNYQLNDFWLTNISYLRLRNVEIGYNRSKNLLKRIGISRVRLYVNGTNLLTLDNVKQFEIDPEITSSGGQVYPQQKLYTFGFNVSF